MLAALVCLTFCTLKTPAMPVNSLMLVGGRWPPGASSVISVSVCLEEGLHRK